jgi:hypothetical protein
MATNHEVRGSNPLGQDKQDEAFEDLALEGFFVGLPSVSPFSEGGLVKCRLLVFMRLR